MRKDRRKDSYVKAAKKTKEERKEQRNKSRIFAPDSKGRFLRSLEKIVGILCAVLGALTFFVMSIQSRHYGTGHSFTYYFCIFVCAAGLLLYLKSRKEEKRMTRFRYYRSFMEDREYVMLSEISSITGRTIPFLQKDLSKMIRSKLFLQADMNRAGTCLFLTKDAFRRYQRGQLILTAEEGYPNPAKKDDSNILFEEQTSSVLEEEKNTAENIRPVKEETDYEEYLHSINTWLSRVRDPEILKSVSDICIRGQQLLYFKDTTMSKEVIRFLEYFLPVTNRILETYVEIEKEGLEDQAADLKVNLNTIQHSFDLFVEKLIEGKRVDVEEDIAAVKMMLSNY